MAEEASRAAREIVAGALGCAAADVPADAAVGSLPQWDSIAHMSIVLAAEERLARRMTPEEIGALATVADIAALLAAGGAAR